MIDDNRPKRTECRLGGLDIGRPGVDIHDHAVELANGLGQLSRDGLTPRTAVLPTRVGQVPLVRLEPVFRTYEPVLR